MQGADSRDDHGAEGQLELVGEVAALLAHDLANRLAVARLTAEVLGNRPDLPGDLADRVATVVKATGEAGELVQQLSAVAGRRPAPPHELDLGVLVHDLTPLLQASVGRRTLDVSTRRAPVVADRRDLEELVLRLVVGGRGRRTSEVGVTVRVDGELATLRVTRAADDAVAEKALDRARALAATCGGTFEVTGSGECRAATVTLPAVPSGGGIAVPLPPGERATVLVVEDDADLRDLVRGALAADGHRVDAVADAAAALAHPVVTEGRLDLLVTDVELPGISGLELAERLSGSGVRVLVISGHGEAALSDALPAGAIVLDKPFGVVDLRASMRLALS